MKILPSPLERELYWQKNRLVRRKKIERWVRKGKPLPPPHDYKQQVIEDVSKQFGMDCLVETGTLFGSTIEAQRKNFIRLYSVEIESTLCENAKNYFKNFSHINIIEGDSSKKIPEILPALVNESVLFWLDGHYSGGITGMGDKVSPIIEELDAILSFNFRNRYILIDDARCFGETSGYPTLTELKEFVQSKVKNLKMEVVNDLIHIY
jgi:hypothetical protein